MSPPISFAKATLSYPIFAASFDHARGYLIVGGGGGAGRSGVGNKITVLDVSSRHALTTAAEIELSRDEDSVTCLANLSTKDGLIVYAGVNGTEEERVKGQNPHFRSFQVEYPPKVKAGSEAEKEEGKIIPLSKTTLFTPPKDELERKEGYQRLIRLSRPKKTSSGHKRIGAIASSLAGQSNEVVVFSATTSSPTESDVVQRLPLANGAEANDVDIAEPGDGQFRVAYCTDYDVWLSDITYNFEAKKPIKISDRPRKIYTQPHPDVFEAKKTRPKLRSLRWLSDDTLLLLFNLPNRSGVELCVLRLFSDTTLGTITQRKKLPRHVKAAVDMDVCQLDADEKGEQQVVVAVAGIDISISIFTVDFRANGTLSRLHPYTTLRDVHPVQMTKIVFQPFVSPWTTTVDGKPITPGPQHIRLASTSLGNTVIVDTLSLSPFQPRKRQSRYVLAHPRSTLVHRSASVLLIGFALLVALVLAQTFIDLWTANSAGSTRISLLPDSLTKPFASLRGPHGNVAAHLRAADRRVHSVLPDVADRPYTALTQKLKLAEFLETPEADRKGQAVIVHGGAHDEHELELSTEVHDSPAEVVRRHAQAKRWEELTREEQERWKERLVRTGQWAREQGETVLKGVFFSQYADLVGGLAGHALG